MKKLLEWFRSLGLIRVFLEYIGVLKVMVDIGSEEIRIIEVLHFFRYFRILSLKSEKLYDSDRSSFFIERFIEKNKSYRLGRVTLTLSGTSVIPLFLTFPGIPREKIRQAVLWEIEKNIPLPIDESYFSYEIVSSITEDGQTVWNVLAVIAKKEEVDKFVETFSRINIMVEKVSFLPVNIISMVDTGNSDNAIGYVYIVPNAVELYIMLKGRIISFSRYIGDFSKSVSVTTRNVKDYFAEFIKRRVSFLERIIFIGSGQDSEGEMIDALFDSLNIVTLPITEDDIIAPLRLPEMKPPHFDLIGYSYRSAVNVDISPKKVKENCSKDRVYRVLVLAAMVLNLAAVLLFPFVLYQNASYEVVRLARKGDFVSIKDNGFRARVEQMAVVLSNIQKVEEAKIEQETLTRKISDAKSSGLESSNIKLVLAELARIIPDDAWLKSLSIVGGSAELQGYSRSADGLEDFVNNLVRSGLFTEVVLKKADFNRSDIQSKVDFTIGLGVIQ